MNTQAVDLLRFISERRLLGFSESTISIFKFTVTSVAKQVSILNLQPFFIKRGRLYIASLKVVLVMNKILYLALGLGFLFQSCSTSSESPFSGEVMGYRPIYITYDDLKQVERQPPKALKESGKIYLRGAYLFVSEPNQGIHIIDNFDKKNPKPIAFIKIPGSQDVELKGDILYSDNGLDLVAVDIANPAAATVVKRVPGVFPYPMYPPFENVKFECPDPAKGYVIGWELVLLDSPRCSR